MGFVGFVTKICPVAMIAAPSRSLAIDDTGKTALAAGSLLASSPPRKGTEGRQLEHQPTGEGRSGLTKGDGRGPAEGLTEVLSGMQWD